MIRTRGPSWRRIAVAGLFLAGVAVAGADNNEGELVVGTLKKPLQYNPYNIASLFKEQSTTKVSWETTRANLEYIQQEARMQYERWERRAREMERLAQEHQLEENEITSRKQRIERKKYFKTVLGARQKKEINYVRDTVVDPYLVKPFRKWECDASNLFVWRNWLKARLYDKDIGGIIDLAPWIRKEAWEIGVPLTKYEEYYYVDLIIYEGFTKQAVLELLRNRKFIEDENEKLHLRLDKYDIGCYSMMVNTLTNRAELIEILKNLDTVAQLLKDHPEELGHQTSVHKYALEKDTAIQEAKGKFNRLKTKIDDKYQIGTIFAIARYMAVFSKTTEEMNKLFTLKHIVRNLLSGYPDEITCQGVGYELKLEEYLRKEITQLQLLLEENELSISEEKMRSLRNAMEDSFRALYAEGVVSYFAEELLQAGFEDYADAEAYLNKILTMRSIVREALKTCPEEIDSNTALFEYEFTKWSEQQRAIGFGPAQKNSSTDSVEKLRVMFRELYKETVISALAENELRNALFEHEFNEWLQKRPPNSQADNDAGARETFMGILAEKCGDILIGLAGEKLGDEEYKAAKERIGKLLMTKAKLRKLLGSYPGEIGYDTSSFTLQFKRFLFEEMLQGITTDKTREIIRDAYKVAYREGKVGFIAEHLLLNDLSDDIDMRNFLNTKDAVRELLQKYPRETACDISYEYRLGLYKEREWGRLTLTDINLSEKEKAKIEELIEKAFREIHEEGVVTYYAEAIIEPRITKEETTRRLAGLKEMFDQREFICSEAKRILGEDFNRSDLSYYQNLMAGEGYSREDITKKLEGKLFLSRVGPQYELEEYKYDYYLNLMEHAGYTKEEIEKQLRVMEFIKNSLHESGIDADEVGFYTTLLLESVYHTRDIKKCWETRLLLDTFFRKYEFMESVTELEKNTLANMFLEKEQTGLASMTEWFEAAKYIDQLAQNLLGRKLFFVEHVYLTNLMLRWNGVPQWKRMRMRLQFWNIYRKLPRWRAITPEIDRLRRILVFGKVYLKDFLEGSSRNYWLGKVPHEPLSNEDLLRVKKLFEMGGFIKQEIRDLLGKPLAFDESLSEKELKIEEKITRRLVDRYNTFVYDKRAERKKLTAKQKDILARLQSVEEERREKKTEIRELLTDRDARDGIIKYLQDTSREVLGRKLSEGELLSLLDMMLERGYDHSKGAKVIKYTRLIRETATTHELNLSKGDRDFFVSYILDLEDVIGEENIASYVESQILNRKFFVHLREKYNFANKMLIDNFLRSMDSGVSQQDIENMLTDTAFVLDALGEIHSLGVDEGLRLKVLALLDQVYQLGVAEPVPRKRFSQKQLNNYRKGIEEKGNKIEELIDKALERAASEMEPKGDPNPASSLIPQASSYSCRNPDKTSLNITNFTLDRSTTLSQTNPPDQHNSESIVSKKTVPASSSENPKASEDQKLGTPVINDLLKSHASDGNYTSQRAEIDEASDYGLLKGTNIAFSEGTFTKGLGLEPGFEARTVDDSMSIEAQIKAGVTQDGAEGKTGVKIEKAPWLLITSLSHDPTSGDSKGTVGYGAAFSKETINDIYLDAILYGYISPLANEKDNSNKNQYGLTADLTAEKEFGKDILMGLNNQGTYATDVYTNTITAYIAYLKKTGTGVTFFDSINTGEEDGRNHVENIFAVRIKHNYWLTLEPSWTHDLTNDKDRIGLGAEASWVKALSSFTFTEFGVIGRVVEGDREAFSSEFELGAKLSIEQYLSPDSVLGLEYRPTAFRNGDGNEHKIRIFWEKDINENTSLSFSGEDRIKSNTSTEDEYFVGVSVRKFFKGNRRR